jgi:hypothetical protein
MAESQSLASELLQSTNPLSEAARDPHAMSLKDFVQKEIIDGKDSSLKKEVLKREEVYRTPEFADSIGAEALPKISVKQQQERLEFHGLPFTKMKPANHSQVLVKIQQLQRTFDKLTLKDIFTFYLENREFYEEEAYTRTLWMVSRKITSQDAAKLRQHPALAMLIGDFDAQIENDE